MNKEALRKLIAEKKQELLAMKPEDATYEELVNEIAKLTLELETAPEGDADDGKKTPDDTIEAKVQERLKQMKDNMDRMAKERDTALKEKAALEQKQKQAEIKRLEEEGKLKEAAEMRAADLEAKLKVLEEENTRLNRDSILQAALASLEFRNDRSREMAYRDIVDQLKQEDSGRWVHTTGVSIQDFVISYAKDENNAFLFRVKSNTGGGTNTSAGTTKPPEKKSLFEMSSNDVLELAKKGQLGNFKY